MTKRILECLTLMAAILFAAQTAAAAPAAGTVLTLKTGAVGSQIIGVTADGNFVTIICGGSSKADMLFPNSSGDVLTDRYYNSAPRLTAYAPEPSAYFALTEPAAQTICANRSGDYTLRALNADGVTRFELIAGEAKAAKQEVLKEGQSVQVRTNQIGGKVVAVTNDGRFFAIMCKHGMIFSSTGDMIYPNASGKIVTKNYDASYVRVAPPAGERATYWPLTTKAVKEVCNYPNGIYTLQINKDGDSNMTVEYVSGQTFEASRRTSGRGF